MKQEKSCGAVVYMVQNERLLFLIEHMKLGHVSLPKGHVEGNETEEETAIREIREETNLEVRLDTVFRHEVSYSPYEGVQKQVVFFAAEALTLDWKNQECEVSSLEWKPFEQAYGAMTYDTDKEVLFHALAYLSTKHSIPADYGSLAVPGQYTGLLYREHAVDIHSHALVQTDEGGNSLAVRKR